ncbi:hypothetical protein [Pseudoalteromonas luteoviolacea]|uniref:hypothetical protein n=1 Tax=Pseudoalteromonas luteoviolacea TaxID=43657 RepID=UPI001B36043F|nr:hypothetical protein [Pseudoalteromonas luteoviolacea]MBQ4839831.1 hypothetical protein [Pseudoalteromonas luteoviolacea]
MSTIQERQFVQVPMPDWCFNSLKALAAANECDLRLLVETFINHYITKRKGYDKQPNKHLLFYASPKNSKPRSMWLGPEAYSKAENFCNQHDTRINRLIFTACVDGLVRNNCIKV